MTEFTVKWDEIGLQVLIQKDNQGIELLPGEASELVASVISCLNEKPGWLAANAESPDGNTEYLD